MPLVTRTRDPPARPTVEKNTPKTVFGHGPKYRVEHRLDTDVYIEGTHKSIDSIA